MTAPFRILSALFLFVSAAAPVRAGLPDWAGDPGYSVRSWTRQEGLPSDDVHGIERTQAGYLWFGTFDGVVRFDGAQLRLHDSGTTEGLLLNRTPNVVEDDRGRLVAWGEAPWLGISDRGTFRTFGNEVGLPTVAVTEVLADRDILVGTLEGAYRFTGDRFEPLHPGLVGARVDRMLRARDGRVVLALRGSGVLAHNDGVVTPVLETAGRVRALAEGEGGALWIADDAGLTHLRNGRAALQAIPAPDAILVEPSGGFVWAGGEQGVYRRAPDTGAWQRMAGGPCALLHRHSDGAVWAACGERVHRDGVPVFTAPARVLAMEEDLDGSVWLGTLGAGVIQLTRSRVAAVEPDLDAIAAVPDGRGGFWFSAGSRSVMHAGPDGPRRIATPAQIRTLHCDPDGTLYAGSYEGLFVLRGDRFEAAPAPAGFGRVYGVTRARDGRLWLSGFAKIASGNGDDWTTFSALDGYPGGPIRFCQEGGDGSLWFATPEGVLRFRDGTVRRFTGEHGLASKRIRAVHVDERGVVWIGTEGRGIARMTFDVAGDPVTVGIVRETEGLFENGVRWIGGDGAGRLWFTSNRGVFSAVRSELDAVAAGELDAAHCAVFDERSGMPSSDCSQIGVPAAVFSGGALAVPTSRGVVLLPLEPGELTAEPVPVLVEEVIADGRIVPSAGDRVTLPASERSFEIAYTALDYAAPRHVRFRYRLEGLTEKWVDAGNRRTAYFTHVPPGRYLFRMQASRAGSGWSGPEATVRIVVPARFHETAWFRGLLLLAVLGFGAGLFQLRVRAARRRSRVLEALVTKRTSELARQTERLEELDQAKSRFFANVSHEFRTPLTLTIGPLEDLLSGMHGRFGSEARRELKTALDSSRSVLDLVNQILDLAKLESGRFRLGASETDLAAVLRTVGEEFLPLSERRRIALSLELPEHPVPVWCDEPLIRRVLRNLLSNAFKFTMEEGTVTLGLAPSTDGSAAEIRVTDSGAGIAPEEQERIFDRFHQAPGGPLSQPGTGIGLSLARELVDLHGGMISVESAPGRGTTFLVRLPFGHAHLRPEDLAGPGAAPPPDPPLPAAGTDAVAAVPEDAGNGSGDRLTILIAEDHPQVRGLVRKHLAPSYRLLEAADGAAALTIARRDVPDLIVSDVMMPGLDGMELTRAVKSDPEIGFIPVLLLTARAEVEDRVAAYERGADAYIAKPFDPRELTARIDGLIAERRRLKARYAALVPGLDVSAMKGSDEAYLASVSRIILDHLGDEDFSVETLARKLGQTRTTLFRRLKEAGDTTPSALIRTTRLEQARHMLESGAGPVNEVAYGVGFRSVSHFCTAFRQAYGAPPGAWKAEKSRKGG